MKNYNPLQDGDPKPHVRSLATKFRSSFESRDLYLRRKVVKGAEKFSYEELCELWTILARTPISEPAAWARWIDGKGSPVPSGEPSITDFLTEAWKEDFRSFSG